MTKTILLVEDEPLISMVLEDALREEGFDVIVAIDGIDAIAALDAKAPQLAGVITDIRLGDGPSGWQVSEWARELQPRLPVLYMSADSAADWPDRAVPNSQMLAKPFAVEDMLSAVSMLVENA
ncbi:response regulator [Rhizobium sp. LjRoot254]|uniref:response regulator n=1 Tax=Rhizobium sp. LjRoot254 TaxID=3342297 RepID=UPI003ECDA99C